jgi:predicted O-methyltransferase YrrM
MTDRVVHDGLHRARQNINRQVDIADDDLVPPRLRHAAHARRHPFVYRLLPIERAQHRHFFKPHTAIRATTIVAFGTSFGISTIYLAAAARANNGRVIGSEIEPAKVKAACANVADSGLQQFVDIREGDALKTLANIDAPVDFVLLDGWKDIDSR